MIVRLMNLQGFYKFSRMFKWVRTTISLLGNSRKMAISLWNASMTFWHPKRIMVNNSQFNRYGKQMCHHDHFFAWEACQECILTINKLMRRGHIIANRCYLCVNAAESCNHVLIWCLMTNSLWSMVYSLFGINWMTGGMVKDELWAWGWD